MTECNRCGDCCEAIGLLFSREAVLARPQLFEERFRRWVVEELVPIASIEELHARLPGLERAERDFPGQVSRRHWYTCTNFDAENRLCLAHDTRPNTCAGFPWYDGKPWFGALHAYPRCSFHADVAAEEMNIERGAE